MQLSKRLFAVILGLVFTVTLATAAPASAEPVDVLTDDWTVISGWSGLANSRATGWQSYPSPTSEQADGWGRVDWSDTTVEVHAGARDLVNDGWCAVTEIRYQIYYNGAWSDWQYRSPAVDCDIDNGQVTSSYYRSRYPTSNLHFHICLGWQDGTTFDCTDWT